MSNFSSPPLKIDCTKKILNLFRTDCLGKRLGYRFTEVFLRAGFQDRSIALQRLYQLCFLFEICLRSESKIQWDPLFFDINQSYVSGKLEIFKIPRRNFRRTKIYPVSHTGLSRVHNNSSLIGI